ncbi:hypothetical protein ACIBJF_17985 [Streptomyces sp. NPDC050743]|uniref:hypothetical protein n=1 Tax=Streptomyces sp. NPDC050743 TaxID=3365634 RepID=UPI003798B604
MKASAPQQPVHIEQGEHGAVAEESLPERGGQPLLQIAAPPLGQRLRDVSAEDIREWLVLRDVQRCGEVLLQRGCLGFGQAYDMEVRHP